MSASPGTGVGQWKFACQRPSCGRTPATLGKASKLRANDCRPAKHWGTSQEHPCKPFTVGPQEANEERMRDGTSCLVAQCG